jgi:hypothetical protein
VAAPPLYEARGVITYGNLGEQEPIIIQIANQCFGLSADNLACHLDIKMSRSINLALLMILMPWGSGCPTALLPTNIQGAIGYGGDSALHSSQQPGVALYLQKGPMANMVRNLMRQIIETQLLTLNDELSHPKVAVKARNSNSYFSF